MRSILFQPTTVGSIPVKNRYAMAPMGPLGFATADGGWNQRGIEYYATRARGGIGLIITGICPVGNPCEPFQGSIIPCPTTNPGAFLRTSRELVERVHSYGSKIVFQAGAGFGRVLMKSMIKPGEAPAAPSAVRYRWDPRITCREMTTAEIGTIVRNFGVAAQVAKGAGFDGMQVHAVHEGYLLDQFAIEMFNNRTDQYGGSLENRLRLAREIVETIHAVAGDDFPVQLRFSPKSMVKDWGIGAMPGEEFTEMGRDLDEGIEAAKLLVSYGYETLDIDVGTYDSWFWNHPPMYQEKGLYLPYAQALHAALPDVPLIVAGRMDDPELAAKAVESGAVTLVSLGRPSLADPEIVNKLESGRDEFVRPCISCQEGCMGRIEHYVSLHCSVNYETGREADFRLVPALPHRVKKVAVIGAGLSGLEAARVLAERGHQPEIWEKSDHIGGVVVAGGQPSFKEDDLALLRWYQVTLDELGVPVHLDTEVTADMVRGWQVDHILVGTGSHDRTVELTGADVPVVPAVDALLKLDELAGLGQVAVIGGGLTGCELALALRERGAEVTIVEIKPSLLAVNGPLCAANHQMLEQLVPYRGVDVLTSATATGLVPEGLVVTVDGAERTVPAKAVVTAIGYSSDQDLWQQIADVPVPKNLIGDAKKLANIQYAIWDGYEVAHRM